MIDAPPLTINVQIHPSISAGSATDPLNPIWNIDNNSPLISISLLSATTPLVSKPNPRSWQKLVISVKNLVTSINTQQVSIPCNLLDALNMHDYAWLNKPILVDLLSDYNSIPISSSVIVAMDQIKYKTMADDVHESEIRKRFKSCLVTRGIGSVLGLRPFTQGRINSSTEIVLVPRMTSITPSKPCPIPKFEITPISPTLQLWRACVNQQFDGTVPMDLKEMQTTIHVSFSDPAPTFNTLTISPEMCLAFGKGVLKLNSLVSVQTQNHVRTLKVQVGALGSEMMVSSVTAFNLNIASSDLCVVKISPTLRKQLPVAKQVIVALVWEPEMDKSYVLDACANHLQHWVQSYPVVAVRDHVPIRITDKELLRAQMARHSCVSLIDLTDSSSLDMCTSQYRAVWFIITHIDPQPGFVIPKSLDTGVSEYSVDLTTQLVHEGSPILARVPPTVPYPPLPSISDHPLVYLLQALPTVQESPMSILVHGIAGVGKHTLVQTAAQSAGLTIVKVDISTWAKDPRRLLDNIGTWVNTFALRKQLSESTKNLVLVLEQVDVWCKGTNEACQTCLATLLQETGMKWPNSVLAIIAIADTTDSIATEIMSRFTHVYAETVPNLDMRKQLIQYIINKEYGMSVLGVRVDDVVPLMAAMTCRDIKRLIDAAMYSPTPLFNSVLTWPNLSKELDTYRNHLASTLGTPRIPNVQWNDIGGLEHVKTEIMATIQLPLQRPDIFANGLRRRSGILFYGPPGVGKTLVAKAVATECQLNFLSVKGPELINMYVGESEANVRRIFEQARTAAPCIVFFDELDSIAPKRGKFGDAGGVMDRIVAQMLAEMDGLSMLTKPVFVMGATNRPDLLDESLLRPGRFDKLVYLDVPSTHEGQVSILNAVTRKFPFASDFDLRMVVQTLPLCLSGADLYALASDAMLQALSRCVSAREVGECVDDSLFVTHHDFVCAAAQLIPSVSTTDLARYRRLEAQFSNTSD